jgi:serine protease Do
MKTSFLLAALTLALPPAIGRAAEIGSSTAEAKQEAAAKAQVDALRTQLEAARAQLAASQAEATKRLAADEAAQVQGRITEARARLEDAQKKLATVQLKMPTEPVTFLGVMTAPAPSSLTTQLGRPAGMGLVVVSVQSKSPAQDVLKVDDLLVKLDDQKLINNDQLTALIRSHGEGDEVTVTYVRGGKEANAKVKLVKQEVVASKPVIVALSKIAGGPSEEMSISADATTDWKIGSSIQGQTTVENGALNQTFTYTNGGLGSTEIKTVNGKKTVTLRNSSGVVEFTGPFDTDEERKAAPVSVQTRVADAESRINQVLQIKAPTKVEVRSRVRIPAVPPAPKAPAATPTPATR